MGSRLNDERVPNGMGNIVDEIRSDNKKGIAAQLRHLKCQARLLSRLHEEFHAERFSGLADNEASVSILRCIYQKNGMRRDGPGRRCTSDEH